MNTQLFMSVFRSLWKYEIKQYCYPGKKTSNYYDYKNGDLACKLGHTGLVIERGNDMIFGNYTCGWAMYWAATKGNIKLVKWIHQNKPSNCPRDALDNAAALGFLEVATHPDHIAGPDAISVETVAAIPTRW